MFSKLRVPEPSKRGSGSGAFLFVKFVNINIIRYLCGIFTNLKQGTMKKLLSILAFSVMIATANGQTLIQNDFKTSGSMVMYWESENTDNITKADDGAKWHLEQNEGMITFWIDIPSLSLYNLSKTQWEKDIAALVLNKM
jgi:hypothetical protein